MNKPSEIDRLYKLILGREVDQSGLKHYLKSRLPLVNVQYELCNSEEFKNKFKLPSVDREPLDNKLHIFVINLKRRPDRKNLIESRLNDLGIMNYEITEAIDGKELPDDLSEVYDEKTAKQIHRVLKKTEVACALSHINIARKIIEQNIEYAIILEDDAELTVGLKNFIKNFNLKQNRFDFLILGSFSSNQLHNGKLKTKEAPYKLIEKQSITYLDKIEFNIENISIHKAHYPSQTLDFVFGTHAYVLSNRGAKKLLQINYPVKVEADNVWNYFCNNFETLFTNPILVHRQYDDSDIYDERSSVASILDEYSDNYKKRNNHPDFGT